MWPSFHPVLWVVGRHFSKHFGTRRDSHNGRLPSIGDLLTELVLRESVDFSRLVTAFVIAEQQSLDTPDESLESIESPRHRWKEPIAKSTTSLLAAGRRTMRGRAIVHDGQCTSAKYRRPDAEMQPNGGLEIERDISQELTISYEDKLETSRCTIVSCVSVPYSNRRPLLE